MAVNVSIEINGRRLVLPPKVKLRRERHNPAIEPNKILGEFVHSIDIPVKGNEVALDFIHTIEAPGGLVEITGARLWIGAQLLIGTLVLHRADVVKHSGTIRADFASNGFDFDIKTTMIHELDLPEYNLGETTDDIRAAAKAACTAEDSDFRFPSFRNDGFFTAEENPPLFKDWDEPGGPPWSYSIWGKVTALKRCILNLYDAENEEFPANFKLHDTDVPAEFRPVNLITLVPCFHLHVIVRSVFESLGYRVTGDFFRHSQVQKVLLTSNYSLEKYVGKTGYARAGNYHFISYPDVNVHVWRAQNDTQYNLYNALPNNNTNEILNLIELVNNESGTGALDYLWHTVVINDKTTGVFQDEDGLITMQDGSPWFTYTVSDTGETDVLFFAFEMYFSFLEKGTHRVPIKINRIDGGGSDVLGIRTIEFDSGGAGRQPAHIKGEWEFSGIAPGDKIWIQVGDPVRDPDLASNPGDHGDLFRYVDLTFYTYSGSKDVNIFDGAIKMKNHIPHWSVSDLLTNLRKAFALDIRPDYVKKTISLNFSKNQFSREAHPLPFAPAAYQKEFTKPKKLIFQYPSRTPLEGNVPDEAVEEIELESPDFSIWSVEPFVVDKEMVDHRVNAVYKSVMGDGAFLPRFYWDRVGEMDISETFGSETGNEIVVNPAISPTEMERIEEYNAFYPWYDWAGSVHSFWPIILPSISEPGQKPGMEITGTGPQPRMMFWLGMQPMSTDWLYPCASPWGINYDNEDLTGLSLAWNGEKGLFETFWKDLARLMIYGTPYEIDVYGSQEEIDALINNRKVYDQAQEFIIASSYEEPEGSMVHAHLKLLKIERQ